MAPSRWRRAAAWRLAPLALAVGLLLLHAHGQDIQPKATEFERDFLNFDQNRDGQIDAQELRLQFRAELTPLELHRFFVDADADRSGTISLAEYIEYAATLSSGGGS
mmetsp:Transcript_106277/g.307616  ORF Transcript_106277/g.307616 Transcript_106277/m.307616 type:complete len:107 (-) Transcript_106277:58-378(-)|eukprot:CAMPEP_0176100190 /NCGR_PEP_ID=MMETSP0120_2-20121206/50249_1 /TAXON_ID=160619 /ORGANISM="Kryptoperidinium foliaceum, Strain CCMP 1326" /LENGTH=106 /DNA_ID=CAMNT_0017434231 /DNA_START=34 /DNA_END=354 /DNA_ORIENTATION=-